METPHPYDPVRDGGDAEAALDGATQGYRRARCRGRRAVVVAAALILTAVIAATIALTSGRRRPSGEGPSTAAAPPTPADDGPAAPTPFPAEPPSTATLDPAPEPTAELYSLGPTASPTAKPSAALSSSQPVVPLRTEPDDPILINETSKLDDGHLWSPLGSTIVGDPATDGYNPRFGMSIATSADGSVLIVGAPSTANGNITGAGLVRAYSLQQGGEDEGEEGLVASLWEPLGVPVGRANEPGVVSRGERMWDNLGDAVALSADGTRAIVAGSYHETDDGRNFGLVRTYDYNEVSGEWERTMNDLMGTRRFDRFGASVALSANGTILAVGAVQSGPTSQNNPGYVLVYGEGGDGSWIQLGQKLEGKPGDPGDGDALGSSLALSADGSVLAAGAGGAKTGYGYVNVYSYLDGKDKSGVWEPMGQTVTVGSRPSDSFGWAVALSADGTTLAVGSQGEGLKIWPSGGVSPMNKGALRVFEYNGHVWSQRGPAIGGVRGDTFGSAVALSGDGNIVVAGSSQYWNGLKPGFVIAYSFVGDEWLQVGQPIDGKAKNLESGDSFGASLALSRDGAVLAVGAYFGNYVGVHKMTS